LDVLVDPTVDTLIAKPLRESMNPSPMAWRVMAVADEDAFRGGSVRMVLAHIGMRNGPQQINWCAPAQKYT
jgi:hypothetical protein